MGLFKNNGLIAKYKQSGATFVVQNLLETQDKAGLLDLGTPAEVADFLVTAIWKKRPELFDGTFGQKPHKIAIAAVALASGAVFIKENDLNRQAFIISLGNILSELETNGRLYPLNSLDHKLLEEAAAVFSRCTAEFSSAETSPLNTRKIQYKSFDEWYAVFKQAAGKANPQLKTDEKNRSFVDFMEHAPLRRAFQDGVEPELVAHEFASQFDIESFGLRK